MKKFIKLATLISCFLMITASSVYSQDFLRNNTNCSWTVKVAYGDLATCTVQGFDMVTVGPYQQVNFPNTGGSEILYAKGAPNSFGGTLGFNCAFYIAQGGCALYPQSVTNSNGNCCGGYTASIFTGFGIYITN